MDAIRHRLESDLCQSRRVFHQKQRRAPGQPEKRPRNLVRRGAAAVAEQDVIGSTFTGETLVTINNSNEHASSYQEKLPETPDVELVWRVVSYVRQELDLEMLRPYLTDFAIRNAINSCLKGNDHKTLTCRYQSSWRFYI